MLKKLIAIIIIVAVGFTALVIYNNSCHYTMNGTVIAEHTDGSITIEDSRGELWNVNANIAYDTNVTIHFDNNKTIENRTDDIIEKIEIKL